MDINTSFRLRADIKAMRDLSKTLNADADRFESMCESVDSDGDSQEDMDQPASGSAFQSGGSAERPVGNPFGKTAFPAFSDPTKSFRALTHSFPNLAKAFPDLANAFSKGTTSSQGCGNTSAPKSSALDRSFQSLAGDNNVLTTGELEKGLSSAANPDGSFSLDSFKKLATSTFGLSENEAVRAYLSLASNPEVSPAGKPTVSGLEGLASTRADEDGTWNARQFKAVAKDLKGLGKASDNPVQDVFGLLAGSNGVLTPDELAKGLESFSGDDNFTKDEFGDLGAALGLDRETSGAIYDALPDGSLGTIADFADVSADEDGTWNEAQFTDVINRLAALPSNDEG